MNKEGAQELLKQFFAGYFNQDWDYDAENAREVVAEYIKSATVEERSTLSNAILEYASEFTSDSELEEKLHFELGAYYKPSVEGTTAKEWLQSVAAQLLET